jgi:DNA-binding beta-propeller fold protein YncE
MEANNRTPAVDRRQRVKLILSLVLVVMFLLLSSMGYFFVKVLQPIGQIKQPGSTTNGLVWIRSLYGFGPKKSQQLVAPDSVAIAPDGTIYATDPVGGLVMAFAPDGTFRRVVHTKPGKGVGQMERPSGLAVDAQGNLYVADVWLKKILVFNSAGVYQREWSAPGVIGIDIHDNELTAYQTASVDVYSLQGDRKYVWGKWGRGHGIAMAAAYGVTSDGTRTYVADANNHTVKAFDEKTGKLIWAKWTSGSEVASGTSEAGVHGSSATTADPNADALQTPQDLVIDAAGRLVVVDAMSFKIIVMDRTNGKILATYGDYGTTEALFNYPSGIAYDPNRDWFAIADTMNNRVQIVRIGGSGGGTAQALRRALSSPFRICAIPLILLLLALVVLVSASRRRREDEPDTGEQIA